MRYHKMYKIKMADLTGTENQKGRQKRETTPTHPRLRRRVQKRT